MIVPELEEIEIVVFEEASKLETVPQSSDSWEIIFLSVITIFGKWNMTVIKPCGRSMVCVN